MSKGKKILLNILYSLFAVILLAATLFHFLAPGIPLEKIGEDGAAVSYLAFPNGDYTGDSALGFLNGQGTFTFHTGEVYEGAWENNAMSGNGKLTATAGTYEGQYQNSMRSGSGTFVWNDGTKYVGQWANDKLNGEGEVTTPDGLSYKGTFRDNVLYEGKITGSSQSLAFSVTVASGTATNKISVAYFDGVTYDGEYAGNCFSGKGVMTFPGLGKYEGNFEAGKRSGRGVFTWNTGASYDGNWSNDLIDGYGTYNFDSVTSITGTFDKGKLNGTYTYTNADGKFKTVWEDGKCTSIKAK